MNPGFLVLTSGIIPVSKAFDRGKGMIARTEKPARFDLFEINSFLRGFIKRHIRRQYDLRYIHILFFLFIQPV